MIFSRIGISLTRSRNVINRASGFAAPTVNASLNQFNRRFLGNLTAIGDGKKLDSRASSLGSDFLAANYRNCRSFYSSSPKNTDHMINKPKSRFRGWWETYMGHIMIEPSKDHEGYWILTQGKRRYVITSESMVSVVNSLLRSSAIICLSFLFGALAFVLALMDSIMKNELGVGLPVTIPRALFALMLSPLLLPVLNWFRLPLFVRIFGRK